MTKPEIQSLLELAVYAPSGENCQPWVFHVPDSGGSVDVWNVPERDTSLYNLNNYGSLIAHGNLIENISLIAQSKGYEAKVSLFPTKDETNHVANVFFVKTSVQSDTPLVLFIEKRSTNRKPYKDISLSTEQEKHLRESQRAGTKVCLLTDKQKISGIAGSACVNEQVVFEKKELHHFFFSHIRWNKEELDATLDGFYLPTLEMDNKQRGAMRLFRHWPVLKFMNLLGVSKMVARDNATTFATSPLVGAITIPQVTPSAFVEAGRVFQRIWLQVTAYGWSLQPSTGIILLKHALDLSPKDFIPKESQMITDAYTDFRKTFNIPEGEHIAVMFRVGDGGEPSAYSPRKKPEYR